MKCFYRFSAILVALMLALASVSPNPIEALSLQETAAKNQSHDAYFSAVAETDIFCLQRPYESLVSAANHLPAPASRYQSAGCLASVLEIGQQVGAQTAGYLARSREIRPALSVSTIIFPFHYFW